MTGWKTLKKARNSAQQTDYVPRRLRDEATTAFARGGGGAGRRWLERRFKSSLWTEVRLLLAERLRDKLEATLKRPIPIGILDITLYRDDLTTISNRPMLRETLIPFDITNLSLVLVDDVLYTGRTVRAALDGIVDLGRPKKVQLAVLIDRGLRELPIQADYVGKHIQTSEDETVEVRLNEEDQQERVVLLKRPQGKGRSETITNGIGPGSAPDDV